MESNIHLIPTDKPSRLFKNIKGKLGFNTEWTEIPFGRINQNIYITDNSEIRDWWVLNTQTNKVYFVKGFYGVQPHIKKIILTTDRDLIQDSIQPIDDEFLEWFVKNPSCERVEIKYRYNFYAGQDLTHYKIIIPQEKPKQLTDLEIAIKLEEIEREEPKQETLEEAVRIHLDKNKYSSPLTYAQIGAKWQQEQEKNKYSEEEVRQMLWELGDVLFNNNQNGIEEGDPEKYFDGIIKQFKNQNNEI
jgi:hypothetical protein